MSGTDAGSHLSRRQFLGACGAAGAAAGGVPLVGAASNREQKMRRAALSAPVDTQLGSVSPSGRQAVADVDRRFQQQQPAMKKTVHAVDNLGLDPTGKQSISGKLSSALSSMSHTRIIFPKNGVFKLPELTAPLPEGPIEIIGNGCTFKIPPNTETKSFNFVLPGGSLIRDITIDQSAKGALQEFGVQSKEGVVRADNVTIKGYAPATKSADSGSVDQMVAPITRTENATVRMTNLQAVSGTAAGTHDEGDKPPNSPENTLGSPMGVGVFDQSVGTVQLANPKIRGWSNGIYGGRTKGIVGIHGGAFVNNFNGQVRLGGGSVVDGTNIMLDDRKWSKKAHPGPFRIGHQGVLVGRVDAKGGNLTDPIKFKNLRVVANSMRSVPALFRWNNEAGPGIIRNCHITNHIDAPIVYARSPAAPAATNVLVDQCLIDGNASAAIMEMHERGQSRIQRTCVKLPDAGPDDIKGAQVGKGMSFGGKCKSGSGLSKPKKVGSGGNLSSLPAPNGSAVSAVNDSAGGSSQREGPRKGALAAVVDGFLLLLLILFGMIALFVAGVLGAIGSLIAIIDDD